MSAPAHFLPNKTLKRLKQNASHHPALTARGAGGREYEKDQAQVALLRLQGIGGARSRRPPPLRAAGRCPRTPRPRTGENSALSNSLAS